MSEPEQPSSPFQSSGPWHEGEKTLQRRLGVAERMEDQGRKVIRNFMPDQHRQFYGQLPFIVLGAVDDAGAPWATLLEGKPGFVSSPDATTLLIAARPGIDDPVGAALAAGSPVGMLGIELHTRRRNRANGTVTHLDREAFAVNVQRYSRFLTSLATCTLIRWAIYCSIHVPVWYSSTSAAVSCSSLRA